MVSTEEAIEAAEMLTRAVASRDPQILSDIYHDDAVIWHNTTHSDQTRDENVAMIGKVFAVASDLRYDEITRLPTPEGFVQYHALKGTFNDGTPIPPVYACIVAGVRDGKITYLREWIDTRQFRDIWQRIKAL